MQNNKTQKKSQKGVAAIFITIMIMLVSLTMVLGLTVIFVGHLKIIRGIGNSVLAFYAANTGIERLLHEDKRCRMPGCPVGPGHPCVADCLGLVSPSTFPGELTNRATYEAKFSIRDGREHFESIGTFEGARRAIRTTR